MIGILNGPGGKLELVRNFRDFSTALSIKTLGMSQMKNVTIES